VDPAARLGACADALSALPPVMAGPLGEWAHEVDPRLALWHACDAVEMTLRFAVALGVGDWTRAGGVPEAVRAEVARRLEQPTLGRWRGMALAFAASPAPGTPLGDLWTWIAGTLEPLLGPPAPTVATSLTELRNRLAHGGGLPQALAAELIATWSPRLAVAFGGLASLVDLRLIAPRAADGGVVLGADDPAARSVAVAWLQGRDVAIEAVVAVRGKAVLPLWPLLAYASPEGEPRAVPQVYVRRGEVRLVMTPLGAERAAVAESSDAAVTALLGAGLIGEPPRKPPVELEIAGFDKELEREAGQCNGRVDEVAAVIAATTGAAGLRWITGPAGSGKSLVVAKAVRHAPESGPGVPALLVFRFKGGDGRCTRETFLRFVVERASQLAGEPPAKGKPVREQARALLATLGARSAIVIDGVEEMFAIDPGIVPDVLASLAKVTRIVAAGRPEAALSVAIAAAGGVAVFDGGLPPMSPADARAMLLDKIGPLSKKLVALDRDGAGAPGAQAPMSDHGSLRAQPAVVNPFVDAVIARAGGLPIYVSYVIGDVLAGRITSLDGAQLPPSLGAYHAQVLRKGGAGAAQQLVTPVVATLAIAHEPLTAAALHALMVRRILATDDAAGRAATGEALAQLGGLVHRVDDDAPGEPRFALFHPTLRDHVVGAADLRMAVATARTAMAIAAKTNLPDAARGYLDDHGVAHLVEAGELDAAAAALAWPRLIARLAKPRALTAVLDDLQRVAERDPTRTAGGIPVGELRGFVRGAAHHLERGGVLALIQAALADGDDSPVSAIAERTAPSRAIRRIDRPAKRHRGARQRTMVGHAAPVRALVAVGDALVSASGDGTLRVWDADDGSLVRVLSPPPSALSSLTRAAAPSASPELAGTMPVLGVHAVVGLPGGRVAAAHGDGTLRIWDLDTGACLVEAALRTYAWSLAVSGDRLVVPCDDGVLRVLDATTLAQLATDAKVPAAQGNGPAYLIAAAVVGDALVVAGRSRGLSVLDPATLACVGELRGHDGPVRALAAVPGGAWVLSTSLDGTVALWDVPSRRLLGRVTAAGGAWSVTASSPTVALVGGRGGELCRVRLPELTVVATARVHAGPVAAVVAMGERRAATGGDDKVVRLVDLEAAASARPSHAGAITGVAAPHPRVVLSTGSDGALKIWDASTGQSLRTVPAHPDGVTGLAAIASGDGAIAWTAAGTAVHEHRVAAGGAVTTQPLAAAPSPVHALVALGPDALLAACADGTVVPWTRATGWGVARRRHDAAALALAADGDRVVSGGADAYVRASDDGPPWRGHSWDVHAAAVAAGVVVTAARDGAIIVWDPAGAPGRTLDTHAGAPRALAITADGARIASATRDDCVVVWRADSGAELARWTCDAPPLALAWAGANTLVIGDAAGEIAVVSVPA